MKLGGDMYIGGLTLHTKNGRRPIFRLATRGRFVKNEKWP